MTRPTASDVAAPIVSGDELLEALASALKAWVGRQAVAEERLTSFAFREGEAVFEVPATTSLRPLAAGVLAAAGDPATLRFIDAVRGAGRTIESLTLAGMLGLDPGDRVALAARVGSLAAAGLVGRDLESDRVTATALGEAVLNLIDEVSRRAST